MINEFRDNDRPVPDANRDGMRDIPIFVEQPWPFTKSPRYYRQRSRGRDVGYIWDVSINQSTSSSCASSSSLGEAISSSSLSFLLGPCPPPLVTSPPPLWVRAETELKRSIDRLLSIRALATLLVTSIPFPGLVT
mmetsp:Transcript_27562/g.37792  ORF Transcript_27562/g.37792 Transcript_27562/m.37792 type:complete len:135 (+) Transcript_27562:349-753(+)